MEGKRQFVGCGVGCEYVGKGEIAGHGDTVVGGDLGGAQS